MQSFAKVGLDSVAGNREKSSGQSPLRMSKCSLKYAMAIASPFSLEVRGACVPISSGDTMKTHAFSRFDGTIGTTGEFHMVIFPSTANDAYSYAYTTSTFDATTLNPFSGAATFGIVGSGGAASALNSNWSVATMNTPFTSNQILSNALATANGLPAQGRIVSFGVRIQYVGTTLNQSGLVYTYHDPEHASVCGVDISRMGSFGDASIEENGRRPCTLVTYAVSSEEQNFSNQTAVPGSGTANVVDTLYPYSNGDYNWATTYAGSTAPITGVAVPVSAGSLVVPVGVPVSKLIVTGVAGQKVHVEIIAHYEFNGPAAAPMLTETTPDSVGADIVRAAARLIPQMKLAFSGRKSAWELMCTAMREVAHRAIPMIVPLAERAALALLG